MVPINLSHPDAYKDYWDVALRLAWVFGVAHLALLTAIAILLYRLVKK